MKNGRIPLDECQLHHNRMRGSHYDEKKARSQQKPVRPSKHLVNRWNGCLGNSEYPAYCMVIS
ncbi:hypothetical protein HF072_06155 [Bacillus sp. RO3]|nr:hypothetical protein [Bacillus sp. RO3]